MKIGVRLDQTHCLPAISRFQHDCIAGQFFENATQSVAYQDVIVDQKYFHLVPLRWLVRQVASLLIGEELDWG